jgi:hypothetical protein
MAKEEKPSSEESPGDAMAFLQEASSEELLEIAAGTAHKGHPLVTNFKNPDTAAYYQKTDDLRRFIVREFRKHADFRGMVNLAFAKMQMQGKGSANREQAKGKRPEGQKPEHKKGP